MKRAWQGATAPLHAALALAAGLAILPAVAAASGRAPPLADPAAVDGRTFVAGTAATVDAAAVARAAPSRLTRASVFNLMRPDEAGRVPRRPRRVVPRGIERPIPAPPRPRMHAGLPGRPG